MGLIQFIVGVLGLLLVAGAFSAFIPLVLLGGLTGSVWFAFGFPIALMVFGAVMIYVGFYYDGSVNQGSRQLSPILKWGALHAFSIWLVGLALQRLQIVNDLVVILLTAFGISVIAQIVKSHYVDFRFRWFAFYFLVYSTVLWLVTVYLFPALHIYGGFWSAVAAGFAIAGVVAILERQRIQRQALPWISAVLIVALLIAYLHSLTSILPSEVVPAKFQNNTFEASNGEPCPVSILENISRSQLAFGDIARIQQLTASQIDQSAWRVESPLRSCYHGKYRGQYPEWYYCDDMVVSRWERTESGAIEYRYYTAVSSQWQPTGNSASSSYTFTGFACENGQKKRVDKETTSYYVYVAKDGTQIKIQY